MTDQATNLQAPQADHGLDVFPAATVSAFGAAYPETPLRLDHNLTTHPLLEIERLAQLGEALPATSVEYNRGDLPLAVDGKPAANGLSIGETIRRIERSNSWAVLKNVEQDPSFAMLLAELLQELAPIITSRTGAVLTPQAYIFISSPEAVTPLHFDPEHNILLQVRGQKAMTVFPAGDARFAADERHESYHTGGPRELPWSDDHDAGGSTFELAPGQAIHVPVMAPHFVRNGPQVSISLSITWRSDWSYAEADARAFNALMRRFGIMPHAPRRWPSRNRVKAIAMRILRRIPGAA